LETITFPTLTTHYGEKTKGYIIYDTEKRKLIKSRNVKFMEESLITK
jgi:hypothetical protein